WERRVVLALLFSHCHPRTALCCGAWPTVELISCRHASLSARQDAPGAPDPKGVGWGATRCAAELCGLGAGCPHFDSQSWISEESAGVPMFFFQQSAPCLPV